MSDDKKDDSVVKPITDYVPKTKRRQSHTPKSQRNRESVDNSRSPTVAEVREWITGGCLAAGQKVYMELAEEHRKVFEMQEAGIMAVLGQLHARVCVLEEAQGIASPGLVTLRETFEAAIAEYQNAGPSEEEVDAAGLNDPCTHDVVDDGNPAKCVACGANVSVAVGPRVELTETIVATVRDTLGERWNTLSVTQRREAVRVYQEALAGKPTSGPTVQ